MAKGKGKPWKPGQTGNPKGRPPLPEDIKLARKHNKEEIERLLDTYLGKQMENIELIVRDNIGSAMELMVANIIQRAVSQGDPIRLNFLLDRLIGKVSNKTEHSVDETLEALIGGSFTSEEE